MWWTNKCCEASSHGVGDGLQLLHLHRLRSSRESEQWMVFHWNNMKPDPFSITTLWVWGSIHVYHKLLYTARGLTLLITCFGFASIPGSCLLKKFAWWLSCCNEQFLLFHPCIYVSWCLYSLSMLDNQHDYYTLSITIWACFKLVHVFGCGPLCSVWTGIKPFWRFPHSFFSVFTS